MNNILIISFHFYPDHAVGAKRPSELSIFLKESGKNISVISAKNDIDKDLIAKTSGLDIKYIPVPPDLLKKLAHLIRKIRGKSPDRNNDDQPVEDNAHGTGPGKETVVLKIKRIILSVLAINNALTIWLLLALLSIFRERKLRNADLVITSGPPMIVHNLGYLMRKFFNTHWIMDLRDPLPLVEMLYDDKNFMGEEVKSELRKNIEIFQEKKWLNATSLVLTTTPGVRKEILSRHPDLEPKIHVIYNGYDNEFTEYSAPEGTGKLTFLYAGSLYYNRSPFPLFESVKGLIDSNQLDSKRIEFNFYGDCDYWNGIDLRDWIANNNLTEVVRIHSRVSAEEINRLMKDSDILINFCQGQPMQIPAKTFEYIGSGKPSLIFTEHDSDTSAIVVDAHAGVILDPDTDDIGKKISELYTNFISGIPIHNGDQCKSEKFSRKNQNHNLLKLIENLSSADNE